jgi:hypothetical protein
MATGNETKIILTAEDRTGNAFTAARGKLSGLADEAKAAAGGVGALGAAFGVLGGVAAGAISVTALKGAVDMLDMLDDLSEKTGIATESLSALRYAGEVVGTPVEALATGVRKLSINMAAAAAGGKEQTAAFQAIGVAFKNLDGSLRGSDAVLGDIASKFASFRDGPEKAVLAVELFGKAGADMIPLLNKGAAGIADLRTEAERLGIVFSGDLAANAAEFNDNLKKIQLSGQAFTATVAGQMLPTLNELARVFLETRDGSSSLAQDLGGGLKTAIDTIVLSTAGWVYIIKKLGLEIGGFLAQANADNVQQYDAISRAVKEDTDRARKDLDELKARIVGVGKASSMVGPQLPDRYDQSFASAMRQWQAAAPVVTRLGDAAKSTGDELQKLLDKLQGKATGFDADYAKNINLLRTALDTGRLSWDAYTKAVGQYVAQQPASIEAAKAMTKEMEAANKVAEERQALRIKEDAGIQEWLRAQDAAAAQSLKAINERIQGLQDEEAAAEIARQQNISLAQAIEQVTLARLREQQAVLLAGSDAYNNVQKEIEARERLIGVINTKDVRDKETEGWKAFYTSLDQTAHDTFVNVLEGGQDIWAKIKNTAKSVFFDWLYQMTAKKWLLNLTVAASGGSLSSGASAGGFSDVGSMLSAGSNLLGAAGNISSFGTAGATLLGGFGSTAAIAGNAALGTSLGLGVAEAAAAAAAAGAAGGASAATAGMAASMGSTFAPLIAAAPYLIAIAGVYALAKSLDKSGTPHTGAGSGYSAAGGLMQASQGAVFNSGFTGINYSGQTEQMTTGLVQSIVGILDSTATTFGKEAGYQAAASFADDSSKDGAWGSLFIRNMQGVLTDWQAGGQSFRTFSDGSAGSAEYLAAISADVRKAIDGIGLPAWATGMLEKLGDAPALDQLAATVQQINATQGALVQLRATLQGFASVGDAAALKLIDASGGIANLAANASAYYDAFYSDGEKSANTLKGITAALGTVNQTVPTTREAYRAQVEYLQSIADTEPAAAPALAVMLQMAGAFASVVPPAAAAADAVVETVEQMQTLAQAINALRNPVRNIEDIAKNIVELEREGANLNVDLLVAQGDTAGAKTAKRAIDTAGYTDAELALYDNNQSVREWIETLNAASAAARQAADAEQARAKAVADEVAGLQQQLDVLTGVTTEKEIYRASLSEVGRGIFDQITALKEQKAALDAAAEAERAVAQERAGLSTALLRALGDTAALRAQELASRSPANRAIQQALYNIEDVQSAISALAGQASQSARAIADLQGAIAGYAQTAAQADQLLNSIRVASGGADNTEAALWASLGTGAAAAQMAAVQQLLGIINGQITTDTQAAQQALITGAENARAAAEELARTQQEAAKTQLDNAQKLLDLGRSLADYVTSLQTGNLSALTPGERLAVAQADYERTLAAARSGDAAAAGKLQGASSAYLEQARGYDPGAYAGVFGSVTGSLTGLSGSMMSAGERTAAAAQQQVNLLGTLTGTATAQAEAAALGNVISVENAAKLAQLSDLVAGIQAQAVIDQAAAQARLTEERARADAIALQQQTAQALLVTVQTEARNSLAELPGVMTQNNAALITEIQALNARIATLEATLVSAASAQIQAAVTVGASTAETIATAVSTAVHTAAAAPEVV